VSERGGELLLRDIHREKGSVFKAPNLNSKTELSIISYLHALKKGRDFVGLLWGGGGVRGTSVSRGKVMHFHNEMGKEKHQGE